MTLIPVDDVNTLQSLLETVKGHVADIQRVVANVEAANVDGEDWVVLDNLRVAPGRLGGLFLATGRLLVMMESIETIATDNRMKGHR
jgi:hypothetical protein